MSYTLHCLEEVSFSKFDFELFGDDARRILHSVRADERIRDTAALAITDHVPHKLHKGYGALEY